MRSPSSLTMVAVISASLIAGGVSPAFAKTTNYFKLETSNNLNLLGETSKNFGDNGNTGDLNLEFGSSDAKFGAKMTAYTQKYSELTEQLGEPRRVDTLELSYSKVINRYKTKDHELKLYAGGQLTVTGNMGGKAIQNFIHSGNGSDQVEVPYSSDTPYAIGFQLSSESMHNISNYMSAFTSGKLKLNSDLSGEVGGEVGLILKRGRLSLKMGTGLKYINPLDQNLVETSTPDQNIAYTSAQIKYILWKDYSLSLATKIEGGDNPNGSGKDEPFTTLSIYFILPY